MTRVNKSRLN